MRKFSKGHGTDLNYNLEGNSAYGYNYGDGVGIGLNYGKGLGYGFEFRNGDGDLFSDEGRFFHDYPHQLIQYW